MPRRPSKRRTKIIMVKGGFSGGLVERRVPFTAEEIAKQEEEEKYKEYQPSRRSRPFYGEND